jgi:hypothetical protein
LLNYFIFEFDDIFDGNFNNRIFDNSNKDITKESFKNNKDGFINNLAKLKYKIKFFNMYSNKKVKVTFKQLYQKYFI